MDGESTSCLVLFKGEFVIPEAFLSNNLPEKFRRLGIVSLDGFLQPVKATILAFTLKISVYYFNETRANCKTVSARVKICRRRCVAGLFPRHILILATPAVFSMKNRPLRLDPPRVHLAEDNFAAKLSHNYKKTRSAFNTACDKTGSPSVLSSQTSYGRQPSHVP